jgi:hypothetical protein
MDRDLSGFRPSRIWKKLPAERRLEAAGLFWADEESTEQQVEAVAAIAAHMKFRTKSVLSLARERKAKYLATLPTIPDTVAARVLVNYHLERQRPMMGAFLDQLGITHEDGLIADENVTKPDAAKARAAATDLAAQFPADDVALYLRTLVSQDPDTWEPLIDLPEVRMTGDQETRRSSG